VSTRTSNHIVVLTESDDNHGALIASHLAKRGISHRTIHLDQIPASMAGTLRIDANGLRFPQPNQQELTPSLDSATAVFYRRLTQVMQDRRINEFEPELRRFVKDECNAGADGIRFGLRNAKWINPLDAPNAGDAKIVTLAAASTHGLTIPDSIVTSRVEDACAFVAEHGGEVIYKTLSNPALYETQGFATLVYTSKITERDLLHHPAIGDDGLLSTPILLQQTIGRTCEWRVFVVGDAVFSMRIDLPQESEIDWRRGMGTYAHLQQAPFDSETCTKLVALVRALGLVYAAADFIQQPDGTLVFLEVNSRGGFLFAGPEVSAQIADRIVTCLLD
jgi:hypothetical protein